MKKHRLQNQSGFTLIEVLMAIVLIGIVLPTFAVYFTGLQDAREPEDFMQAVFLGRRQLAGIENETMTRIPPAGTYTCAAFRTTHPPAERDFNIDCSDPDYRFDWQVEDVDAGTPNDGGGTFGKRVTLTVSRNDGNMNPFQLYTLF